METLSLGDVPREVWVAFAVLFAFFLFDKIFRRKKYHLPPGPSGLPVVGYLPFMTRNPHLKFIELSKKYGDVLSVYLGSKLIVILNNGEIVREAFGKRELLARPPDSPFDFFDIDTPFFGPDFEMWQEQRRFVVQSMKDLGLGKSKIEGHLQDEIQYFLNILKQSEGRPMNVSTPLTPSMSNNITALVFGERFQYEHRDRVEMDAVLNTVTSTVGLFQFHAFFPWMRKLPFFYRLVGYDKAMRAFAWLKNYIDEKVKIHRGTLDADNVRDFIDSYLLEMQQRKENMQKTTFSESTMQGCIINLFGAGSETVRSTISWCLYVAAAFPEVQEKVRREVREATGGNRPPEYPDHASTPFACAVIREVMRWKTLIPLNVPRYAHDDVKVAGYDIPKGTIVVANLWAVHHDPRCWEEPDFFRPERFLDRDGRLLKNVNFMPFSVGKRACPGENMAQMEVFLYLASILQRFRVAFAEGYKPRFEAELKLSYTLKPYKLRFLTADLV